jgi:ATP-dependent RNA helicase DDX46/PRP5
MDVEIKRGPAPDFMRRGVVVTAEKPTGFDAMPIKPCVPLHLLRPALNLYCSENLSAVERAKMVAANLNASLRAKRQEHNLNADDVRFGDGTGNDFHAVVPINDYPQKARWKVTNKETISSLVELTGASITNKGIFYDKGKEPEAGMPPKLHLLIEAVEESKVRRSAVEDGPAQACYQVKRAILEIKRLLVEATTQALEVSHAFGIA